MSFKRQHRFRDVLTDITEMLFDKRRAEDAMVERGGEREVLNEYVTSRVTCQSR
jgi:hypothetical protein